MHTSIVLCLTEVLFIKHLHLCRWICYQILTKPHKALYSHQQCIAVCIVFLCLLDSTLICICHCFSLSIRNQTENDIITNLTGSDFVWIGLHREKVWSDGSTSLFRHWATGQPNSGQERCVTTAFSDSGRWSDDNCTNSFPFICYLTSNASYFCSHIV